MGDAQDVPVSVGATCICGYRRAGQNVAIVCTHVSVVDEEVCRYSSPIATEDRRNCY